MDNDNEKPSVICSICRKSFSKIAYRNRHLKNVHNTNPKGEQLPDNRVTCILCDKHFKEKSYLQHHVNAVHSAGDDPSPIFECDQCSYKTIYKSNLKKHFKKHFKKDSIRRQLKCEHCPASFTYEKHLRYHERKTHNIGSSSKATVRRKCPLCTFVSTNKSRLEINTHFEEVHSIPLSWESYSFENLTFFQEWKNYLEKSTTTSYIERKKLKQYVCRRSGNYKKTGKNIRNLKTKGSCKINAFCPSEIKINVNENGSVDVRYLPCHVGHENQLEHIRLAREEKTKINAQLLNETLPQCLNDHPQAAEGGGDTLIIEYVDNVVHTLEEHIVDEVCVESTDSESQDALDMTPRFTKTLNSFVEYIHKNVKSPAQMRFVEKATQQIISTLNAMTSTSQPVIPDTPLEPPNINIEK